MQTVFVNIFLSLTSLTCDIKNNYFNIVRIKKLYCPHLERDMIHCLFIRSEVQLKAFIEQLESSTAGAAADKEKKEKEKEEEEEDKESEDSSGSHGE